MIETALKADTTHATINGHELAPNVWLRQTETDGQFVEIIMPPFELSDLLEECEQYFPMYAIQVFTALAKNHPMTVTHPISLSPEIKNGLKNTQILGTVLARHEVRGERAVNLLPELHQAFGLAMKGRIRLTADPVPDL